MIETPRLVLRPWRQADVAEFVRVTNTPEVMATLGGVMAPEDFAGIFARIDACQKEHGFSLWLAERRADGALLGFCGMKVANAGPIAGEVEIGWRLRADAWGQGYAREGAQACLDWAWRNLTVPRVVAITAVTNTRSWGLMERLGMTRLWDMDFEHPSLPQGHSLRPHITYAMDRPRGF